ncbi:unnamed protein product [Caenorhabditis auriculariae]|uniref:Trafficking protein particle complex subunit 11 n=1 Tax=Caenorhabditis auriculariae TaxID=2777116 RepID=A0A8S1GWY5_9PELO|nr:unnamed protein product [Caenorhabditis auriculariae]
MGFQKSFGSRTLASSAPDRVLVACVRTITVSSANMVSTSADVASANKPRILDSRSSTDWFLVFWCDNASEAGDWLSTRPHQLIFLTGLDPSNKHQHGLVVNAFRARTPEKPPLNLRIISGELDIAEKTEKSLSGAGILRREWPLKYLENIPALIVLFVDLEWDHPSWQEKKTEAESKVASIRASSRQGTRIALVMLQDRATPTTSDDNLAADRAHEICQICSLNPKQLFVLPLLGEISVYVSKLESAFHELAQGFYQQKLKSIRARSIPNNSPSLIVRQLFKLAFISELRQDTHSALRNYRLAYDQCKDHMETWDAGDVYEWRSVVGLLNYKMCELCFLHSTALEAINQMRRHQSIFFSSAPGTYPTPQLSLIELLLWKAKQCWYFAHLFEQAVLGGLSALATLNPGTHLDQAANIYSAANKEISLVKQGSLLLGPYPNPDPLGQQTEFFGQRPWRVGISGLASPEIEAGAVNAIKQRLVVNHAGVISLLSAAMTHFKKYNCIRMQKKVMCEMADVYYANGDVSKALQLWSLVVRDSSLPFSLRSHLLHKAACAAFVSAAVKEYAWCCVQFMASGQPRFEKAFQELIAGRIPVAPFDDNELSNQQMSSYKQNWSKVLTERQFFVLQASRIDSFLFVEVTFLSFQVTEANSRVPVCIRLTSSAMSPIRLAGINVAFSKTEQVQNGVEKVGLAPLRLSGFLLQPKIPTVRMTLLDLGQMQQGEEITVSCVSVELGDRHSPMFGQIDFDNSSLNRPGPIVALSSHRSVLGVPSLKVGGFKSVMGLKEAVSIKCLIGEVATAKLQLCNLSKRILKSVKLEFKRNEQSQTEAAAVLFVDKGNELKSELVLAVATNVSALDQALVDVQFSAQLVGSFDLSLEVSYLVEGSSQRETGKVLVAVEAKEPFSVRSAILNMNGIPMISLLNHCEHVLKVDITSAADIVITSVEFLLADVVTFLDASNGGSGTNLDDEVFEQEVISYNAVIAVSTADEDVETPLGRLAVEWKRAGSANSVRSLLPLCRVAVLPCPIGLSARVFSSPAAVRQPIDVCFDLQNHSNESIELTATFELSEVFMFNGEKKSSLVILPGSVRKIHIVVMALSAGRLAFPRINLRSPQIAESTLQHVLRTLPAAIFVLPRSKEH